VRMQMDEIGVLHLTVITGYSAVLCLTLKASTARESNGIFGLCLAKMPVD